MAVRFCREEATIAIIVRLLEVGRDRHRPFVKAYTKRNKLGRRIYTDVFKITIFFSHAIKMFGFTSIPFMLRLDTLLSFHAFENGTFSDRNQCRCRRIGRAIWVNNGRLAPETRPAAVTFQAKSHRRPGEDRTRSVGHNGRTFTYYYYFSYVFQPGCFKKLFFRRFRFRYYIRDYSTIFQ